MKELIKYKRIFTIIYSLLFCCFVFFAFAGLSTCGRQNYPRNNNIPNTELENKLGPGDVFEVKVFNLTELSNQYQISSQGTIDFPLIGRQKIVGLTPPEVADLLKQKLINGEYLLNPQISIFVKEWNSRKISVFGEVRHPGTFPFEQGMTIVQVISIAGGFTNIADSNKTIVTRIENNKERKITVPVKAIGEGKAQNFYLKPGDTVFVPETIF